MLCEATANIVNIVKKMLKQQRSDIQLFSLPAIGAYYTVMGKQKERGGVYLLPRSLWGFDERTAT